MLEFCFARKLFSDLGEVWPSLKKYQTICREFFHVYVMFKMPAKHEGRAN